MKLCHAENLSETTEPQDTIPLQEYRRTSFERQKCCVNPRFELGAEIFTTKAQPLWEGAWPQRGTPQTETMWVQYAFQVWTSAGRSDENLASSNVAGHHLDPTEPTIRGSTHLDPDFLYYQQPIKRLCTCECAFLLIPQTREKE